MKVSNSRIQCYKACRRLYELKYIYGMSLMEQPEALQTGSNYHDAVEELLKLGSWQETDDDPKLNAMVHAFGKYIKPMLNAKAEEEWFEYKTESGHTVIGRYDAIDASGAVIEHKTTSQNIDGDYWASLENNEQIMTYMLANNCNEIIYTVIRKPSIRQKQKETDEEFQQRLIEWYDEDTDSKVGVERIFRTAEELEEFRQMQDAVISEMESCKLFYRNESHCWKWGRTCEYAPICNNFDPNKEYAGFVKNGVQ